MRKKIMENSVRSLEIEIVLQALCKLTVPALEDATDYDLTQMMHAIELIQKQIHARYYEKVCRPNPDGPLCPDGYELRKTNGWGAK